VQLNTAAAEAESADDKIRKNLYAKQDVERIPNSSKIVLIS